MIQIYSQGARKEDFPESQWYVSKDTFQGITFDIQKNPEGGVHVDLSGKSTASGETYINLTWPFQPTAAWDFIRMEVSAPSSEKEYCGMSYVQNGTKIQYFNVGESSHDFYFPAGAKDIRAAIYVKGGERTNLSLDVNLYYCKNPAKTEQDFFASNGDMTLIPTKCTSHAILNGTWEAELEHPIDQEERWKYITDEAVVKMPSFNGEQLFRIKNTEKADSGVKATMEPIFMDAMDDCFLVDVRPTNKNGQEALDIMTAPNSKYSGKSDITTTNTAYYQFKNLIEAINGDDDNSFVNRWGGEILFDNFTVIINERVGGDYGVELRYGKNIPADGLTEEVDIRSVVTRIYPKAYNGYTMSGDKYVDSPLINNYPTVKTATITFDDVKMAEDASEDDEENGVIICETQEELDAALKQRCQEQWDAGLDKPSVTISADMVLLAGTEQYKDFSVLETVSLGDTVHCIHNRLGIRTDARVIELKYDAIQKKVTSVVLGDFQYNYFNNVSSAVNRVDGVIRPDGSLIAEKIAGFIDGAMASLRAQYNVAKKQDVMAILFENLDESSPLYGAMALGTQGLMISKKRTADGRDWDWTTAMTANGMMAGIIVAGILADKTGKNYWDLDKGLLHVGEGGVIEAALIIGTLINLGGEDGGEIVIRNKKGEVVFLANSDGVKTTNGEFSGDIEGSNIKSSRIESAEISGTKIISEGKNYDIEVTEGRISFLYKGKKYAGITAVSTVDQYGDLANIDISISTYSDKANIGIGANGTSFEMKDGTITMLANNGTIIAGEVSMIGELQVRSLFPENGWSGTIPIITKIQSQAGGGIQWWTSSITVKNGIITNAPSS